MKSDTYSAMFKMCTFLLAFFLVFPSLFTTANAFTASRVSNVENTSSVTVTINDVGDEDVKKTIDEIPLLNQMDYYDVLLGPTYSIAEHGCGIVSFAMVASYMMDEFVDPVDLAKRFAPTHHGKGTMLTLFEKAAEAMGLVLYLSENPNGYWDDQFYWDKILTAIKNDQPVIALYRGDSLFSNGGHFVVITGMTEVGKFMVNDPNGWNWSKSELSEGFKNGFTEGQIRDHAVGFWIFSTKEEYKASLIKENNENLDLN